jgi:hypothetical protein
VARFRNISGAGMHVGRADGPLVEAGDVTAVGGDVTQQDGDAYVVGEGEHARAWPKALWELVPEAKSKSSGKAGD